MFGRLESVVDKFNKLEQDLGNPGLLSNQKEYQQVAREHSDLAPIVERYFSYKSLKEQVRKTRVCSSGKKTRRCGNSSGRNWPS